ncbi:hypothetical protein PC9H_005156 [Pleurotus ostreatus]|uniref:Ankyrin repeat protein n=1 Tax=Pleurotus ostreatus TaxID=5322 RepID=A0A8H7DSP0_PLEOS|nr:uncharacterized protein PC9H_005156 [Pleurotus ostreatus]KAF7433206.1 hypothetical protein PC9H_005156 [Pleurotus ostreatus]
MSIFDDARKGTLNKTRLNSYLSNNPNVLDQQEPRSGLTPLAIAIVQGFPEEVELLLKSGANPGGLSGNGATPLLLAAWRTTKERPLIIKLLLAKIPSGDVSIDATIPAAQNNTPLMYAVKNKDLDSIRMLRTARASLTIKNDEGFNAKEVAESLADMAVVRALDPEKETSDLTKLAALALGFLLYIVAWVNTALGGVIRRVFGLNPEVDKNTDQKVNGPALTPKEEFVKNVDKFVKGTPLERLAQKAIDLQEDTEGGDEDDLQKMIKVTLHQQVIYCDDSSSMKREDRWENQKKLIKQITQITTRILPEGEGVALRFINRDVGNASNLTLAEIGKILDPMPWQPGGNTEIGTYLRSKILQPLVYSKIKDKTLERPLLISIITDGMPEPEDKSELANAIVECGDALQSADYPRESMNIVAIAIYLKCPLLTKCISTGVKFMIGQIGSATSSTKFLDSLRNNSAIAPVIFVTSDRLDSKFADLRQNSRELDRWLIETLFSPLKEPDTKKTQ